MTRGAGDFQKLLPTEFLGAQVVETHISVVFLTDTLVLKFKKPVAFDFINMSTLERRWHACLQEVHLNRRLAPDTYLGVLPLFANDGNTLDKVLDCRSEATPNLPSAAVEAAVLMKHLPEENQLANLLTHRDCGSEIDELGTILSRFHNENRIPPDASELEHFVDEVILRVRDNYTVLKAGTASKLSPQALEALQRVEAFSEAYIAGALRGVLRGRCLQGCIVDGHGDLRAEHIYFEDSGITAIDCLEFNAELRKVDVLNDLAFLCMDLERLKRPDLAATLHSSYQACSGDTAQGDELHPENKLRLFTFYKIYRAMVRAKVAFLKESQLDRRHEYSATERFLALASHYALGLDAPFVIAIGGFMGSGKSTLARYLGGILNADILSTDEVRKELYAQSAEDKQLGFAQGKYSAEGRNSTYQLLFSRAKKLAQGGNCLIIDASFMDLAVRAEAQRIALDAGADFLFVLCEASKSRLEQRLEKRTREGGSSSDGRKELLEKQIDAFHEPSPSEGFSILKISTEEEIETQARGVIHALQNIAPANRGRAANGRR